MMTNAPLLLLIYVFLYHLLISSFAIPDHNREKRHNGNSYNGPRCCMESSCADDDDDDDDDDEFETGDACSVDIIIIGCGSSGSIMSKLLSDFIPNSNGKRFSVLCLEQGDNWQHDESVKYFVDSNGVQFSKPSSSTKYSVRFTPEPISTIPSSLLVDINYGTMVGGTGNHDYCYVVHPSRKLCDNSWAAAGGQDWNYDNIVSVMNHYENYLGASSTCPRGSTSGGLNVFPSVSEPNTSAVGGMMLRYLIDASPGDAASTTPITPYYNCYETSATMTSEFWATPLSTSVLARSSTGLSYLGDQVINYNTGFAIEEGRKLRVLTQTLVNKINFDSKLHATSVEASVSGKTVRFYANRQIVVAANAIQTPAVLERSGVGDASRLRALGIPVVYNNTHVGENLQVHVGTFVVFGTNATIDHGAIPLLNSAAYLSVLPQNNGFRSVQFYLSPFNIVSPLIPLLLGWAPPPPGYNLYYLGVTNVSPRSRGSVHVWDASPSHFPGVSINAYSDAEGRDKTLLLASLKTVYTAIQYMAGNNTNYSFIPLYPPPSAFQSDSVLWNYIVDFPYVQSHYSSTASIGTVVDGNLKLKGVTGVTVADTSVAPDINNGNTRTQAIIAGYKAAKYLIANLPLPS